LPERAATKAARSATSGQQGRRADHRHLLAREGRDEGRAQRHLGLAEADIAADQPVHRLARRHVFQHVGDGLELVVGLGIGEAGAEFLVEAVGRTHRLAATDGALGRDLDQPVGHVGDALLQPGLARLPGDAAQAIELGRLVARAVATEHVDVLDRHEELVATLVGEPQAVVTRVLDFQRYKALVPAHAMLAMHDEVAVTERSGLGDEALRWAALLGGTRQAVAKDVLFADDFKCIQHEALLERPDRDADRARRQAERGRMVGYRDRRGGAMLLQEMPQAGGRAFGVARDHDPAARRVGGLDVLGHLVEQVDALRGAGLGEAFMAAPMKIDRVRLTGRGVEGRELRHGVACEQAVPFRRFQVEALGRHGLVIGAAAHAALPAGFAAGVVVVGDQLVPRREGFGDLVIGRDDSLGAIVEQGLQVIMEQRQPVLHADMALTGRHRLVEDVVAGDIAEQLAIAAAEARDAVLGQKHFAHRQQHDLVARAGRALAHGVERADRLEAVAEQVEAQRLGCAGWKKIDQAAAHRELARLHHGFRAAVAILAQEFGQPRDIERLPLAQHDRCLGIEAARRHPLQRSPGRCQHDARRRPGFLGRGQPRQGLQPLRHDVGMRRQPVVGQAVPGGEDQHLALGCEEA